MVKDKCQSAKITPDTPVCEPVRDNHGPGWTTQYLCNGNTIINWYGHFGTREEAQSYINRVWGKRADEQPFKRKDK